METPKSITVSLDWAKKLIVEAGWKHRDTCFVIDIFDGKVWCREDENRPDSRQLVAAPTAEEILRRLPDVEVYKTGKNYRLLKRATRKDPMANQRIDQSLANAAAAMWCYLVENNLLPPQD